MTLRVYKYPLGFGDWVTVKMPAGAEVLSVQCQHGSPYLWARVSIENVPILYHFRMAGTGHELGSNVGRHIDSFQMANGGLVFHVFAEEAQ